MSLGFILLQDMRCDQTLDPTVSESIAFPGLWFHHGH